MIALYTPWPGESPDQGATQAPAVSSTTTDLESIRASSRLLSERMDELSTESDRALQLLDRRLSEVNETTLRRLSELEGRFEQVERLEQQLTSLASQLEDLEGLAAEVLSEDSAEQAGREDQDSGVPDAANTESGQVTEAPSTAAPAPVPGREGQEAHAEISEGATLEPMDEPVAEKTDPLAAETPKGRRSGQPEPEPETIPSGEPDLADGTSEDPLPRELASAAPPPAQDDERQRTPDRDSAPSRVASPENAPSRTQWAINLIALASKSKTQSLQQDYAAKGVDAELIRNGKLFALRVPGFADRAEAVAYGESIKQKLGIGDVWIYQYRGDRSQALPID